MRQPPLVAEDAEDVLAALAERHGTDLVVLSREHFEVLQVLAHELGQGSILEANGVIFTPLELVLPDPVT